MGREGGRDALSIRALAIHHHPIIASFSLLLLPVRSCWRICAHSSCDLYSPDLDQLSHADSLFSSAAPRVHDGFAQARWRPRLAQGAR